jgi:hypothetical protein
LLLLFTGGGGGLCRYMGAEACQGASSSSASPELVREQKCYEYFPHRLAADPYWLVPPADHRLSLVPLRLVTTLLARLLA